MLLFPRKVWGWPLGVLRCGPFDLRNRCAHIDPCMRVVHAAQHTRSYQQAVNFILEFKKARTTASLVSMASKGIIYEYEDGGRYCGEWENDAAHGHGVCTGPDGNGLFQGLWERGHQVSGVFTWPSGQRYLGKWRQGVREGVGKETKKDGTEYCGEFTRDSRGPFGVLRQPNGVVFRGTWKDGVQNGLGTELYIDGGACISLVTCICLVILPHSNGIPLSCQEL